MEGSTIEYDDVEIDIKRKYMTLDEQGQTPIKTLVLLGVRIPKAKKTHIKFFE